MSKLSYRKILLTQNQFALVDAEDYEWLMQWKWQAAWAPKVNSFYATATVRESGVRRTIRMHCEILKAPKGIRIDHRNHDTLDNRKLNLRLATSPQNGRNRSLQHNNKSGYRGVIQIKSGKWNVTITIDKHRISLGCYDTAEEASAVYEAASRRLGGEFHLPEKQAKRLSPCGRSRPGAGTALPRMRSDNASGYVGVSWHTSRERWKASIFRDGKTKHLGFFATAKEASDAYQAALAAYEKNK